jgi:hypothetical protein
MQGRAEQRPRCQWRWQWSARGKISSPRRQVDRDDSEEHVQQGKLPHKWLGDRLVGRRDVTAWAHDVRKVCLCVGKFLACSQVWSKRSQHGRAGSQQWLYAHTGSVAVVLHSVLTAAVSLGALARHSVVRMRALAWWRANNRIIPGQAKLAGSTAQLGWA